MSSKILEELMKKISGKNFKDIEYRDFEDSEIDKFEPSKVIGNISLRNNKVLTKKDIDSMIDDLDKLQLP